MRAVDVIIKKRDKGELTHEEIEFFIKGFVAGDIPARLPADVSLWRAGERAAAGLGRMEE